MTLQEVEQNIGKMIRFKDLVGNKGRWSSGTLLGTKGGCAVIRISGPGDVVIKLAPERAKLWQKGNTIPVATPPPAREAELGRTPVSVNHRKPRWEKSIKTEEPEELAAPSNTEKQQEAPMALSATSLPAFDALSTEPEPPKPAKRNYLEFSQKVELYNWCRSNSESCSREPFDKLAATASMELNLKITPSNVESTIKQAGIERELPRAKEVVPATAAARIEFLERTVGLLAEALIDINTALGETIRMEELRSAAAHSKWRVGQH